MLQIYLLASSDTRTVHQVLSKKGQNHLWELVGSVYILCVVKCVFVFILMSQACNEHFTMNILLPIWWICMCKWKAIYCCRCLAVFVQKTRTIVTQIICLSAIWVPNLKSHWRLWDANISSLILFPCFFPLTNLNKKFPPPLLSLVTIHSVSILSPRAHLSVCVLGCVFVQLISSSSLASRLSSLWSLFH